MKTYMSYNNLNNTRDLTYKLSNLRSNVTAYLYPSIYFLVLSLISAYIVFVNCTSK